jgi:hypothetical protein
MLHHLDPVYAAREDAIGVTGVRLLAGPVPRSSSAERQGRVSSASHGLYGQSLAATPLVSPVRRADEAIRRTNGRDHEPLSTAVSPGSVFDLLH